MSFLKSLLPYILIVAIISTIIMRQAFGLGFFVFLLYILVDLYAHSAFSNIFTDHRHQRAFTIIYIMISLIGLGGFYYIFQFWKSESVNHTLLGNLFAGFAWTLLVSKFVLCTFLAIHDAARLAIGAINFFISLSPSQEVEKILPDRRRFINLTTIGLSSIPFAGLLFGITKGKYYYQVEKIKLAFKDLPKAFHGFKVVQISDAHAGSWDSINQVKIVVEKINALKPDIILFTGDLINVNPDEINPYISDLAQLTAPMGKFAVLGNHDYYGLNGNEPKATKKLYFAHLHSKFKLIGFDLLNNESRSIRKAGENINILGVENWGRGRWFPKRGDLDKSLSKCDPNKFNILMSHDPTHWEDHVIDHPIHIHLTLSGHTHGCQFGFNLPGFKWSPVQYRYERWMGLYEEKNQFLYVNRGLGFLAFPGRVGMWPEITLFELSSLA